MRNYIKYIYTLIIKKNNLKSQHQNISIKFISLALFVLILIYWVFIKLVLIFTNTHFYNTNIIN